MKMSLLELCVDSPESAENAVRGGADRLELCANLVIGGTTPPASLFRQIRAACDIPVNVLLRPRFGDFCYSDPEFEMLCDDVRYFRKHKADGVVIGILREDGTLDLERLKRLKDLAGDLHVTLHRAFDVCQDPETALEEAVGLGIDTILTSGQQDSCLKGRELIRRLWEQAGGRLRIMAGAGVSAGVIREMQQLEADLDYHMSGKVTLESRMKYRKAGVNMGLPSLSEYEIYQTDERLVREARNFLDFNA